MLKTLKIVSCNNSNHKSQVHQFTGSLGNGQGGRSAATALEQEHAFPKRVSSERARRAGGKNARYVRTAPWRAKRRQKFVQYQYNILIRIHDQCASCNNFPFFFLNIT